MSEGRWRYYSRTIAGPAAGTVRDELPLSSVTIVDRLLGAGSLTGTIALRDPKATRSNLDTENTLLVAERDGIVQFAGPLQSAAVDPGGDSIAIECAGAWDLVRRRAVRNAAGMTYGQLTDGEVRFDGVDQLRIVEDLIASMQAVNGGDLGISVSYASLSGVERDRAYEADKGKSIGEAIEQLAAVEHGFDWALEPVGDAFELELVLRLSHPFRGRVTGYRFDYNRASDGSARSGGSSNVLAAGLTEVSRELVTRFTAVGPGEGVTQLVHTATDPNTIDVLPLLEGSNAWLDVTNADTLAAHAVKAQQINGRASRVPRLVLAADAEPSLGAFITGDIVGVSLADGWLSFDGNCRVISRTITVDDDGGEQLAVDVAELGRFTA